MKWKSALAERIEGFSRETTRHYSAKYTYTPFNNRRLKLPKHRFKPERYIAAILFSFTAADTHALCQVIANFSFSFSAHTEDIKISNNWWGISTDYLLLFMRLLHA